MKIPNWLKSSADPLKVSLTLKSAVPFIAATTLFFGLDVSRGDLDGFVEAVVMVVTGAAVIYGFARKVYHSFADKFNGPK